MNDNFFSYCWIWDDRWFWSHSHAERRRLWWLVWENTTWQTSTGRLFTFDGFSQQKWMLFLFYSRLTQCLALQWLIQWSTPWQTSWLTPWIAPFRENSMFAQHIIDCEFPRYDDGIGEEGQRRLRYIYQGISITKNYILLSDTHFSRNGPF